jgi:hypothetical protein
MARNSMGALTIATRDSKATGTAARFDEADPAAAKSTTKAMAHSRECLPAAGGAVPRFHFSGQEKMGPE